MDGPDLNRSSKRLLPTGLCLSPPCDGFTRSQRSGRGIYKLRRLLICRTRFLFRTLPRTNSWILKRSIYVHVGHNTKCRRTLTRRRHWIVDRCGSLNSPLLCPSRHECVNATTERFGRYSYSSRSRRSSTRPPTLYWRTFEDPIDHTSMLVGLRPKSRSSESRTHSSIGPGQDGSNHSGLETPLTERDRHYCSSSADPAAACGTPKKPRKRGKRGSGKKRGMTIAPSPFFRYVHQ